MIIGIPKEIKDNEFRVSLPPGGARELVRRGNTVIVEDKAGQGSGFSNDEYIQAGATIAQSAEEVWKRANMIIKVKEPLSSEYRFLRDDLILFTYLHLAANEELTHALVVQDAHDVVQASLDANDAVRDTGNLNHTFDVHWVRSPVCVCSAPRSTYSAAVGA